MKQLRDWEQRREIVVHDYSAYAMEPYVRPAGAPKAFLVDLDGTTCKRVEENEGGRGPFDWARVGEDLPNDDVLQTVVLLASAGAHIILMSGRDEVCRRETEAWLREHLPCSYVALHMRPEGSRDPDWRVKFKLFNDHVRYDYDVIGVLDDRRQVVTMWRSIGLTVFQVDEGDF